MSVSVSIRISGHPLARAKLECKSRQPPAAARGRCPTASGSRERAGAARRRGESCTRSSAREPSRKSVSSLIVSSTPSRDRSSTAARIVLAPAASGRGTVRSVPHQHLALVRVRFVKRKRCPRAGPARACGSPAPRAVVPARRSAGSGYAHTRSVRVLPITPACAGARPPRRPTVRQLGSRSATRP